MPVFHLYNIQDTLHSSSDGQRMETQINTVNARFSPKYFGLQKGVSAYTLVANHVPINAKIIGTHEHESHYALDLLYYNTSDIKTEWCEMVKKLVSLNENTHTSYLRAKYQTSLKYNPTQDHEKYRA